MRHAALILLLAFPTATVADERAVFYDTWGTATQCAREPLEPGWSVLAEPFEISADWLKRGQVWCSLNWFPVEPRGDGVFTGAFAQCGEDGVRDYILRMALSGDALTLRWDFFSVTNGPLSRCPSS